MIEIINKIAQKFYIINNFPWCYVKAGGADYKLLVLLIKFKDEESSKISFRDSFNVKK